MIRLIGDTFKYLSPRQEHGIKTLYVALLALSLHWSLVSFINSSFLGQFLSSAHISSLFLVGSLFSIIPMFLMSRFLRRIGNYKLTLIITLIEIGALLGMAYAEDAYTAAFFFLVHFITVPLIFFGLDVFIETIIGSQEKRTGSTRGLYLVFLSLAGAFAPLLSGSLIEDTIVPDFTAAYMASAVAVLPFAAIIILYFKNFRDPSYPDQNAKKMVSTFLKNSAMRNIFTIQLLLQIFFTWMTIYTPIYLAQNAGFSWSQIGLILFVGLLAYVIFEYPVGIIADRYIGEKEMMAAGFLILAISTSWLAFLPSGHITVWMVAMFFTRVGASFVEATSESFFFKHAQGEDTDKLSLFRLARPLSSIIVPALGGILFVTVEASFTFILVAALMVPGIFVTLLLKDTR